MHRLFHGVEVFFDGLSSIRWEFIALAIACHLVKLASVSRSWRNIVAVAYPGKQVRWRSILGAYAAGVGINAILPARSGEAMKLYLAKRGVEGSTYPTLTSTLVVQTLFDSALATLLLLWAAVLGVLPGLDLLPKLPSLDFSWAFDHPKATAIILAIVAATAGIAGQWLVDNVAGLRARFAQGFEVLRQPRVYLTRVVPWQLADWSLRVVTIFCFLNAFGIEATLRNALLVQVSQSVATAFPFTPAGAGTEQALVVYVLRGHASSTALLGFSVGMKLTLIATNAAVGFVAIGLMLRRFHWRPPALDVEEERAPA